MALGASRSGVRACRLSGSRPRLEQRSEFRIVYPLPARPQARIGTSDYPVFDLSERALRLDIRRAASPLVAGERVAGKVVLAHRVTHAFAGRVLRSDEQSVVVVMDEGFRIDLAVIFREQRHLRSKFPDWR